MTRRSPPGAYGITLLGQRNGAGHSYAPMGPLVPQVYPIHLWYFFMSQKYLGTRSKRLPTTWTPLGAIKSGNILEFLPAPLLAASRGSDLYMSRLSLTLHAVPKNSNHNWYGSPSTKPVHCANDTRPQYDDESTWLLTGDGFSFLRRIGLTANDAIPPTFRTECEKHA
jgi:hypothetical protein